MNKVLLRVAAAGAVLLFAAVLLHSFRAAPPRDPRPARLEIPAPAPPPEPVAEAPRAPAPGRAAQGAERLLAHLEELRRRTPPLFEEDFGWIRARLSGELFAAAGAVDLLAAFRRHDAVGDLAALLNGRASSLLKDVVIETLGSLGGDGAVAALITVVRNDPDEGLRARAASALGGFSGPEAYAVLAAALRDPSSSVRSSAAAALSRLPSREAVDRLLWALAAEADPRIQADFAIGAYAAGGAARREEII